MTVKDLARLADYLNHRGEKRAMPGDFDILFYDAEKRGVPA